MTSQLNAEIIRVRQHEIVARAARAHHTSELSITRRPRRSAIRETLGRLGEALAACGWAMAPMAYDPWLAAGGRDQRPA